MAWLPKKKIVVPIDFTGESQPAIDAALEMAENDEDVHVIHVLFPLDAISPGVVFGDIDDHKREAAAKEHGEKYIAEQGISGVKMLVRIGEPATEICEYAEDVGADLIILPSHGYHGLKRMFFGSIAEGVIRHAHCAVLVLRRSDAD